MEKQNKTYKAEIIDSSRDFTGREKLKYTELTAAINIGNSLKNKDDVIEISIKDWILLKVENDKADDKIYNNLILIDDIEQTYYTGSESFMNRFFEIYTIMKDEDEEIKLKIYKMPSKNRQGQSFVTCNII